MKAMKKWIALAAAIATALALSGCGSMRSASAETGPWNDGVWNSVLGYHGPTNVLIAGAK